MKVFLVLFLLFTNVVVKLSLINYFVGLCSNNYCVNFF
jgi:hypothetical protein